MKKIKPVFLFFILLFIQFYFLAPMPIGAQSLWDQQVGLGDTDGGGDIGRAFGEDGDPTDIREVVVRIIKVFLSFLGIIFTILIIWAGFKWMMSRGNENEVSSAKSQIKSAIIGVIIILLSYIIVDFVTSCIMDISSGSTTWMCQ